MGRLGNFLDGLLKVEEGEGWRRERERRGSEKIGNKESDRERRRGSESSV